MVTRKVHRKRSGNRDNRVRCFTLTIDRRRWNFNSPVTKGKHYTGTASADRIHLINIRERWSLLTKPAHKKNHHFVVPHLTSVLRMDQKVNKLYWHFPSTYFFHTAYLQIFLHSALLSDLNAARPSNNNK